MAAKKSCDQIILDWFIYKAELCFYIKCSRLAAIVWGASRHFLFGFLMVGTIAISWFRMFKIGTIWNQNIKTFRFWKGSKLEHSDFKPQLYQDIFNAPSTLHVQPFSPLLPKKDCSYWIKKKLVQCSEKVKKKKRVTKYSSKTVCTHTLTY